MFSNVYSILKRNIYEARHYNLDLIGEETEP